MKIPTILKGDDAGAITLSLDSSHNYTNAVLAVAYQGVAKTFAGLSAGGTVSLVYTHAETAGFRLGCYPIEARLLGSGGSVETVSNAEWRIKVTDILAEVNAGGAFEIVPGAASVPVTEIEELSGRYKLADLAAKINEVCRVLAQKTALALAIALAALGAFAASVHSVRLDEAYNDAMVVTNVTFDAAPDFSTNNTELVDTIQATAPAPDFSTNNTELVDTIRATAPVPSNYAEATMPARLMMRNPQESQYVEPISVWEMYSFRFPDMPGHPIVVYENGKWGMECEYGMAIGSYDSFDGYLTFTLPDAPFERYIFDVVYSPVATFDKVDQTAQALTSSISDLTAEAAPAVNGYARLYSFITGSTNANIVVTNYQLTAEAEAERTHYDPSDPDLSFSTVPPSLRLEDASSGTNRVVVDTRDWTVWYFAQKIGGAMAEAVSTAIDTCRAWCGFTATGLENPVPDTLVVDVPNIWLMAGKTFEKHIAGSNAVWIIRSSGVVMPISDNSQSAGGFLELTDAFGTPYIRFKKTGSYFVDPAADGVEYDSATGAWLVTYTTASKPKGGANAVLAGSTTYPGKAILKAEDDADCPATITWTGSANNWVMHAVPKPIDGAVPKSMFFGAVVEVQGQDYIEYLRPMSIPHLLVDGVKIAPDIPASHPVGTVVPWKVVQ